MFSKVSGNAEVCKLAEVGFTTDQKQHSCFALLKFLNERQSLTVVVERLRKDNEVYFFGRKG